jgi:hypothetical protein
LSHFQSTYQIAIPEIIIRKPFLTILEKGNFKKEEKREGGGGKFLDISSNDEYSAISLNFNT